jgi:hypothetical protein
MHDVLLVGTMAYLEAAGRSSSAVAKARRADAKAEIASSEISVFDKAFAENWPKPESTNAHLFASCFVAAAAATSASSSIR